jgi:hypothetical protein
VETTTPYSKGKSAKDFLLSFQPSLFRAIYPADNPKTPYNKRNPNIIRLGEKERK